MYGLTIFTMLVAPSVGVGGVVLRVARFTS